MRRDPLNGRCQGLNSDLLVAKHRCTSAELNAKEGGNSEAPYIPRVPLLWTAVSLEIMALNQITNRRFNVSFHLLIQLTGAAAFIQIKIDLLDDGILW